MGTVSRRETRPGVEGAHGDVRESHNVRRVIEEETRAEAQTPRSTFSHARLPWPEQPMFYLNLN